MRTLSRLISVCVVGVALLGAAASSAQAQTVSTTAPAPSGSATPAAAAAAPAGYYVEFRAAEIGTYGHSYAMYGRLGGGGQPADRHYTDLHPMGNYAIMAIGHLLPVPANTRWDPDVLKLRVSSAYRVRLNAAQYQRLLGAVARHNADRTPVWNAVTNNCNHYMAQLAQAIGLRTPNDFQFSIAFIPALRDMNDGRTSLAAPTRRIAAPAEQKPKS